MEKDTSVIPKGQYCYSYIDGKIISCPYWRQIEDRANQYDGWCDYLEKGDLEISKEMIIEDVKTGKKTTGDKLPFPVSLLWDQCKECNINKNDDENNII